MIKKPRLIVATKSSSLDLDNSYGGSMGKQKNPFFSRLKRGLSITQIGFSLGSPIMGFNETHSLYLPLN